MKAATQSPLMTGLFALALAAGRQVMAIYAGDPAARRKADNSPVTEADLAAERVILGGLRSLAPDVPVVSEERVAAGERVEASDRFFLVDPLDGTKEFLERNGEFTINVALIEQGRATAGVIFAPALPRLFWAEFAAGAFEAAIETSGSITDPVARPLKTPPMPDGPLRVVASRSHRDERTNAWLGRQAVATVVAAGSSLKFCLLAAGEADIYPRFGPTMEWDTAAGQAILEISGGRVLTEAGTPLLYGKREAEYRNPAFIATVR